jgi:transketolase
MENQSATVQRLGAIRRELIENSEYLLRQGVLKLLAIKDSDVRILTLEQSRDAVDKGLHSGGAFSAVIPLVTLFYGGFITPVRAEQRARRRRPGVHLRRAWLLRS